MAQDLYQMQLDYLRKAAIARGIDPDVAVKAMSGEGLGPGIWQSNYKQPYGRERSYGAMQLHVDPTGRNPGMGNDFVKATGLDPADPKNFRQMIDFGLDNVVTGGWGPWYGAKAKGVTGMMGVGKDAKVVPASYSPPAMETPVPGVRPSVIPMAPTGVLQATQTTPAGAPQTPQARELALQQYVREGGTGGLRPGNSGVGPQNLQQALQMRQMNDTMVSPAAKKAQGVLSTIKSWFT